MMQTKQLIKTEDGLYEIRERGTLVEGPCAITQFSPEALSSICSKDAIELIASGEHGNFAAAREARG